MADENQSAIRSHPAGEYACDGKNGYFTAYHVGHQWVCTDQNCSWRRQQNAASATGNGEETGSTRGGDGSHKTVMYGTPGEGQKLPGSPAQAAPSSMGSSDKQWLEVATSMSRRLLDLAGAPEHIVPISTDAEDFLANALRSTGIAPVTETLLSEMVEAWFSSTPTEPMPKRDDEPRFFERMERVYGVIASRSASVAREESKDG